jgi:hypothetical protein
MLSIDKDDIIKIIFENGKEMEFQQKMTNPETYSDNKKNILKIDFLSPITGNTTFGYERSLRPEEVLKQTLESSDWERTRTKRMRVEHL